MPFPRYAKKEEIPAGAEDVYEERDGEWHPKLEDTSGLKATVAALRTEKSTAEAAARTARAEAEKASRERDALAAQVGDPEKKVADLLKKFDEDVAAARQEEKARADAAEVKLRELTLGRQAEEAYLAAGGRPEKAATARRLYMDRLDMAEDRPVVKDAEGKATTKTLAEFMTEEFKKAEPELFTGTKAGGGGASGINGGGAPAGGITIEQLQANPSLALEAANAVGTA